MSAALGQSASERSAWSHLLLVGGVGAASVAALAITGHAAAAFVPMLAVTALYALLTIPLRTLAVTLVAVVIVSESPQDLPAAGLWVSPLQWVGTVVLSNLNHLTGVDALSFSLLDVACGVLVVRLFVRRQLAAEERRLPRALTSALIAFFVTLVAVAVAGLARGGNVSATYWQLRQVLWLPALVWILASGIDGVRDLRTLGQAIAWSATAKALVGIYFFVVICLPRGLHPPYVTTHSDTVLFVLALAIAWIAWVEHPDARALRRALLVSVPIGIAVVLNDRRVAWVELAAVLALTWVLAPRAPGRRKLTRFVLACAPLAAAYIAVGWTSDAAVFRPVESIRTMTDSRNDSSTRYRDIENYNLARTFAQAPLLGTGFGHPYVEAAAIDDISRDFSLYRYIPHNSILWLLASAGVAGFCVLLSPLVVAVHLAASAWFGAEGPEDRTIALSAIAGVIAFLLQAFGDMGTQDWLTVLLLAVCIAASGRMNREVAHA